MDAPGIGLPSVQGPRNSEWTPPDRSDLAARLGLALEAAWSRPGARRRGEPLRALEGLLQQPEEVQEEGVRRTFWNAWRLGSSARAHFGPLSDAKDFAELLGGLDLLACTAGPWEREPAGSWMRKQVPCPAHERWGRLGCDLFREAADGLTCGLADGLRFVRLESPGRGGSACWSRIYRREEPELGWRPCAPREAEALASVRDELERRGVLIDILGLVENRMVYRPKGSEGGVDRSLPFLERAVRACLDRRLPGFEPVAAVPRPVLAEAAD